MTTEEAKEVCRRYEAHTWVFEVADDGTVVVGGNDRRQAAAEARRDGYTGPIVHAA